MSRTTKTRINIWMDDDTLERLRAEAVSKRTSVSELIRLRLRGLAILRGARVA